MIDLPGKADTPRASIPVDDPAAYGEYCVQDAVRLFRMRKEYPGRCDPLAAGYGLADAC